ncbi:MAG: AAA family ATPase [Desulfamplus sp.]|nr:AAA family ATPase [Desulfamplus sp.]
MKLPYGICDFREIVLKDYFYCDRTDLISSIEKDKFQLFLRPRRFGKSLLLSMLENYYDVAKKDQFDDMFGKLKIGKNPTPLRNSYFILKWDFSCIDASGSLDDIRQSLFNHINLCIRQFILNYKNYDIPEIRIDEADALSSIKSLSNAMQSVNLPVFLLIDEYDNFANEVMMSSIMKSEKYESLVQKEGILKAVFKNVKAAASNSVFDRIFITGVSPVVMSDITSGFNIAKNIYFKPKYNHLCGFTAKEVEDAVNTIAQECGIEQAKAQELIKLMRIYYNGYRFSVDITDNNITDDPIDSGNDYSNLVYNPTLALYFFDNLQESCKPPKNMLDHNLSMEQAKLDYISKINGGRQLILDLMQDDHEVAIEEISQKFGIERMLSDKSHDKAFLVSFLYYFGVLTIAGQDIHAKTRFKVPNTVMKRLYIDQIHEMLLPQPMDRDYGKSAAEKLYQKGDIKELCSFVENRYFKIFSNRDYRWANELTVKTAFLTLLYNDILFIMDSEKEIDRRFADLTMIIRPDMRKFQLFDVLIEFKFVSLATAGVSGEEAKALSVEELENLPQMREAMTDALEQVKGYSQILKERYSGKDFRLKSFAVVSLGFDRLCWEEI